jgi:hypothetical protein
MAPVEKKPKASLHRALGRQPEVAAHPPRTALTVDAPPVPAAVSPPPEVDPSVQAAGLVELMRAGLARRSSDRDPLVLARAHYVSLDVTRRVLEELPEAWRHVRALASSAAAPEDLRRLVCSAAGLPAEIEAEPALRLGDTKVDDWSDLMHRMHDHTADLKLDDEAIIAQFERGTFQKDLSAEIRTRTGQFNRGEEFALEIVRLYARAIEREVPDLSISYWGEVLHALPPPEISAPVVLRLAHAMKMSADSVFMYGHPLSDLADTDRPGFRNRGPLGEESRFLDAQDTWWLACYAGDPATLRIDDPTLRSLFPRIEHLRTLLSDFDPEEMLMLFRLLARTREIGLKTQLSLADLERVVSVLPDRQDSVDVMRRVCRAFGWDEAVIELHGRTLDDYPPSRDLEDRPVASGRPLGMRTLEHLEAAEAIKAHDHQALAQISDDSILQGLGSLWTLLLMDGGDDLTWNRTLLRVLERAVEVGSVDTRDPMFEGYFAGRYLRVMPLSLYDDPQIWDSIARLLLRNRLDPAEYAVGGRPLLEHAPFIEAAGRVRAPAGPSMEGIRALDMSALEQALLEHGQRDPVGFAEAVIDRALAAEDGERAELIAFLKAAAQRGLLERRELREAMPKGKRDLDDWRAWPFSAELVRPLIDAVEHYERASCEGRRPLAKDLARAAIDLATFYDPSVFLERIFARCYASDLERVSPLDQVERVSTIDLALAKLRSLPRSGPIVRLSAEEREQLAWVDAALRRAVPSRLTHPDDVLALAEGFAIDLVSREVVELAGRKLPAALLAKCIDHIRSRKAREILRAGRARPPTIDRRLSAPAVARTIEELAAPAITRSPKAPRGRMDSDDF